MLAKELTSLKLEQLLKAAGYSAAFEQTFTNDELAHVGDVTLMINGRTLLIEGCDTDFVPGQPDPDTVSMVVSRILVFGPLARDKMKAAEARCKQNLFDWEPNPEDGTVLVAKTFVRQREDTVTEAEVVQLIESFDEFTAGLS